VRLHIIGLPSAGKTTLGEDLSMLLTVPHHDLDGVAFVDEQWTMRPAAEREAMILEILAEPSFVTEGGFIGWTEPLFAAADHILWLDPPLRTLISRHVSRHGDHPWRLVDHLRFQMLMYVRRPGAGPAKFDRDLTRRGIELALQPWASKVFRLRRGVAAAHVVESLPSVT
jgi:adenylate kinase family enzyme